MPCDEQGGPGMSSAALAALPCLLDAVSQAEDSGDHEEAICRIRGWLDGAAIELSSSTSSTTTSSLSAGVGRGQSYLTCPQYRLAAQHSELRGRMSTMMTRVHTLKPGAFPRAQNERESAAHFAMSVEAEAHESWEKKIVHTLALFEDKMAAIERAEVAEAALAAAATQETGRGYVDRSEEEDATMLVARSVSRQHDREERELRQALEQSANEYECQQQPPQCHAGGHAPLVVAAAHSVPDSQPPIVHAVAARVVTTRQQRGQRGECTSHFCCCFRRRQGAEVLTGVLLPGNGSE